jgi:hypothetical protein
MKPEEIVKIIAPIVIETVRESVNTNSQMLKK